ncbi:alpha/beta hydrolase [Aggregatibacter actinomycetemcomitans]|uniref:alpha/beta hydrolase n=1 Tax=Aggregatibacter actinomycetemcomitans TaxID=714 RepID=UPI0011D39F68|nr:alpha/beta hydrolase [Aggregatibacter actinomycetemcomitans]TYA16599.1 alpha/beta hydrolase [Aggregatibacter actinomycetemcomitans]TYA32369.1 alpha/beta hydrolase [Aggregatibacter actinomycetemcomitans]TYB01892.1 alpha/beta hydrolase [Aggregatibacter actinomycetemcomitans]TYB15995.1 alpha/beta hydrolase [Aggregatibacter actinomycetemcomitans]TYB17656.1 alpha/beta hydrolase [Aggregatibacter actinomycetemcomitans]
MIRKSFVWGGLFLIFTFISAYVAALVERDFGQLEISTISFMTEEQQPMVAKLYRPQSATDKTPKPGLLALHGYQSDKEATNTFGALELAKRGFVVLAIDHFGHGYSTKLPASNKNMSGANNGYQYLKSLPFVDSRRLGIFGHSTGALNAIRVAQLNPDHKAINGQSSNGGDPGLHNYLLTQGLYEEIAGYREKSFPVKELAKNTNRLKAFSLEKSGGLQWDHTYGNFTDGLPSGKWVHFAMCNIIATMILYPLFTQWGGANEPIASMISFMPLEMGNGIVLWLVVSAIVNYLLFFLWSHKKSISWQEFGILAGKPNITTSQLIGLYLILAAILVSYLYGIAYVVHSYWQVELRFLWPAFKPLTPERFALFPIYWLFILFFFYSFNGLVVTVQMRMKQAKNFTITLIGWTIKTSFFAVSGLVLLWLFHFIPDFMQLGPGFDLIGLPQFGGRWMMMLSVIIPQFIVLILISHWCYLKTGYVYLGVFLTSILMTWIIVGGQVIGRFLA